MRTNSSDQCHKRRKNRPIAKLVDENVLELPNPHILDDPGSFYRGILIRRVHR